MSETLDLSSFVSRHKNGLSHMELAVEGIGCASCIRKIESGLAATSGIAGARLNFTDRRLAVDWHDAEISAGDVVRTLEQIMDAGC
jgi:Cu2+-exporting ATPase